MTDRSRFPDARRALVTTQNQTIAMCGATFVSGARWGTWDGALLVTTLKGHSLLSVELEASTGRLLDLGIALTDFGRLRSVTPGARRGPLRRHEQRRRHRPHPAAHTRLKRKRRRAATALNPSRHVIFLPSSYVRP